MADQEFTSTPPATEIRAVLAPTNFDMLPTITKYDLDRIEVTLLVIMLVVLLSFVYLEYKRK